MTAPARPTVFITGTSSGIGRAAVHYFSRNGWNVAATLRAPEKERELGKLPNVRLYALDVTDGARVTEVLSAAWRDFGRLDAVVNNAGFGTDGVFEAMSDDVIERQFDTNVFGLMRITRAALALMRPEGRGTIVQISSMGGRITFPLYSIYHSTKWAVEGFTESLQYEAATYGVRLKLVEPGAIRTEFYGTSRRFISSAELPVYDGLVAKCEKASQEAGAKGEPPEVVAAAIFRAVTERSSRLRVPVGSPAPLLLFLRKLLPDTLFFAVVRKAYGL